MISADRNGQMPSTSRNARLKLGLCTFGSPRVGNKAMTRLLSDITASVRVVCAFDPIPTTPPWFTPQNPMQPNSHVPGLTRAHFNAHLITSPTLLEEALRVLLFYTMLLLRCCCCSTLYRVKHHSISSYITCLSLAHDR